REIISYLMKYLWPSEKTEEAKEIKKKVVLSVALVLVSKALTIQVPFLSKELDDTLSVTSTALAHSSEMAVPVAIVLGYEAARFSENVSTELSNAVLLLPPPSRRRTCAIACKALTCSNNTTTNDTKSSA
ncbi:Atp-binding protein, partial [Globisporangium polare]